MDQAPRGLRGGGQRELDRPPRSRFGRRPERPWRPGRVDAVLLTHFHSDHVDGLGELAMLRWVSGANETRLPVIGPTGVVDVVSGFNHAYRQDAGYRTAHHGEAVAPPSGAGMTARSFEPPLAREAVLVWDDGGLRVQAFTVEHEPASPAVGYRFDYGALAASEIRRPR